MKLNRKGEIMVGSGVKILIAVVLGSMLLFGTYTVVNETVMPSTTQKVAKLFEMTPEAQNGANEYDGPETIYDNEIIANKYLRRLFLINKNLIEQKYGVSIAEADVRWFLNGVEVTTGYYYSQSDGNPVPEGTRIQAIITIPKGSLEDNPNCCTIITNYSD